MKRKNSILFVRPDYHCTFIHREQFIKAGWIADIYLPRGYPDELLYSNENLIKPPQFSGYDNFLLKLVNHTLLILWWLSKFWKYEFHFYYGEPPIINFFEQHIGLGRLFGANFLIELWLAKLFGVKLIFISTGCREEDSKEINTLLDDGNVCGNCGMWNRCDDKLNNITFSRVNRFFDLAIGTGTMDSTQYKMTHFKYKVIDLYEWRPELEIPREHILPVTENIRIMHSAYLAKSGRDWRGRNIKGSPFILEAIERLKNEGYSVEYFYVHDKPSNQMRYYQAQADIVVEQLIYGWWGSTFIEAAALGKPVVCYLRPSWKEFFFKTFPEYSNLPVVEANTNSIYPVLKKLVTDHGYRIQKGKEARLFAEKHFDPQKNTAELINILRAL